MKIVIIDLIAKIVLYSMLFGGLKILELDRFIISLTNLLNAISKTL